MPEWEGIEDVNDIPLSISFLVLKYSPGAQSF